jgi:MoaA/NifB/PqqE/SkfB family radical SAM enzyme
LFDNFINIKDFKKLYRQICSYKKRLAFRLNDYYTHNPTAIIIELSNRCNLACKMCWFHGENGIGDRYKGLELETEEILKFLKQLVPFKPKIYFGGSEPFIRDDFLLILEYLKSQDFKVSFATNGSLLNMGMIERLVE